MRVVTPLAFGEGFALQLVSIRAESTAWSAPERFDGYRLVFVRRGAFRARVGDHELVADPVMAYLGGPGQEHSIAHRSGAEDRCLAVLLSELPVAQPDSATTRVPVTGELAVAYRELVVHCRGGEDSFALAERVTRLVGTAVQGRPRTRCRTVRPSTALARRRLAEAARELLSEDGGTLGLRELARRVGCSPHHLSRVFHEQTGMTLTRYRNRLRVLNAVEAIEGGERDLAGLAHALGFADHAHFTRAVRRECGQAPRALRSVLARRV